MNTQIYSNNNNQYQLTITELYTDDNTTNYCVEIYNNDNYVDKFYMIYARDVPVALKDILSEWVRHTANAALEFIS